MNSTEEEKEIGGDSIMDKKGNGLGVRHVQALLLFFCIFMAFFLRVNISVGIVSMTDRNSSNPDFDEFGWSEKEKGAVLSSFFWGYLVSQAPAGQLGQSYSPKLLLLLAGGTCAFLTALTPAAARYGGWGLLAATRVGQGLAQGFFVPLSYTIISKWAPPNERNRFVGFSLNGGTLGAMVGLPVCGLLAKSSAGWPSIFYVSSALSFIWVVFWYWFGADSPDQHPYIAEKEKLYINTSIINVTRTEKRLKTPWKAIFTCVPFWALICAHIGNGWAFAMVLTEVPSYINSILGFDIDANGLLSALPYLALWVLVHPVCWMADVIKKKKLLSETVARKLWTTISQTGGCTLILFLGFVGRDAVAAMTLLTVGVSLSAFMFCGFSINHLDLAPNFAGVLMGISNGLENITTILAPLAVGWIIQDTTSIEQWREVFIVTAIVGFLGNLVFVIFGTAELQPWNEPKDESEHDNTS